MAHQKLPAKIFLSHRVQKMALLAVLIFAAAGAMAVIPTCCEGTKPVRLAPILLWSGAAMIFLLLYLHSKYSDPQWLSEKPTRYSVSHFLRDPHFCSICGTRRILVFQRWDSAPDCHTAVVPGTLVQGRQTAYYCPHCKDTISGSDCQIKEIHPHRVSRNDRQRYFRTADRIYRPSRRYIKIHLSLLSIMATAVVTVSFLVRLHVACLLLWAIAFYLFCLSAYYTASNLRSGYCFTEAGLLQRTLFENHLLPWKEVISIVEFPSKESPYGLLGIYAKSGNWILSTVLADYEELYLRILEVCGEYGIPFVSTGDSA